MEGSKAAQFEEPLPPARFWRSTEPLAFFKREALLWKEVGMITSL